MLKITASPPQGSGGKRSHSTMEEPERTSQIVESKLQASRWFKDLQWNLPTRLNGKVICVTGMHLGGRPPLCRVLCGARRPGLDAEPVI